MPEMIADRLLSWATDIEQNTIQQAARTARLPFIEGHVALMPDAHLGFGATVGSVIPTRGAIVPSAVGVDIGCGMVAAATTLNASDLPESLAPLLSTIEEKVPAGVGQAHEESAVSKDLDRLINAETFNLLKHKQQKKAMQQFGTLGSGNHFVEVCLDEQDSVWVVLHSGSRGVGNNLATQHIELAKGLMKRYFITLEDPDLAYVTEGTPEFDAYIRDLLWAQDYAKFNRIAMMDNVLKALFSFVGQGAETERISCHHNYAERENHMGKNLWITRKGAIRARVGDRGVIPGSMGTSSYIVTGLGHPGSFTSASHGAGRRMSRGKAREQLTVESLTEMMGDRTWMADRAKSLVDEHPDAYKSIDEVMEAQKDLVRIDHTLHQVLNFKGT